MQGENGVRCRFLLLTSFGDWPWSSVRDYMGSLSGALSAHRVLPIDRVPLPTDEGTRI